MKIEVEVRAIFNNPNSPLKAAFNVVLDGGFVIRRVKLIDNGNGLFISMPSIRDRDGNWRNVCHPINSEFRERLQDEVIAAYMSEPVLN